MGPGPKVKKIKEGKQYKQKNKGTIYMEETSKEFRLLVHHDLKLQTISVIEK